MQQKLNDIKTQIPLIEKKLQTICKEYHITSDELLLEMVKFLSLIYTTNKKLSPSLVVDLAWHEFILFTKYYGEFCSNHFNRFIHHTPSENENQTIYQKTIELYIKQYGEPNETIWGTYAKNEWEASNCGTCHN
jgi:hypothetical protein